MSDERQSQQRMEYKTKDLRVRLVTPADSDNGRKRRLTWRILLIIALIALILTIIFGYFALGPGDTIKR